MRSKPHQKQLGQVINYAKSMGIAVFFREKSKDGDSADWSLDGKTISVYRDDKQSNLSLILCLIHELGHHLDHIYNNNKVYNHKFERALNKDDKRSRGIVLKVELAGMKYWHVIYNELGLTFPIKELEKEMEIDTFVYQYYYKHGKYPNKKTLKDFRRKINVKYKK